MKSNRVKSSRIESSQVESSQIKSNRVQSSGIESNRIESSPIISNRVSLITTLLRQILSFIRHDLCSVTALRPVDVLCRTNSSAL
jgi:hypothetical protein